MTIPFINETESKAIQFRKELLEQLKQSNLVQELIKCHNVALDKEKSIDERYEALKFISENENLYNSLKYYHVIPAAQIGEKSIGGVSVLNIFKMRGIDLDYSDLSKTINSIFPTQAVFEVDFEYIIGHGVKKLSISQMEKYLSYIISHTHQEIYDSLYSILPYSTYDEYIGCLDEYDYTDELSIAYFKQHIENDLDKELSVEDKINIVLQNYKERIANYCASSISCVVDSEGYQYSTSSLYC